MRLARKLTTPRGGRKSWSEPPFWSYDNLRLPFLSTYALTPDREAVENNFEGYVRGAYKANGIVFACIAARQRVFSQARFQWREYKNGRPGDLFGSPELGLLERPWPNGTTGELLSRMEADASLAGNSYETTADDNGRLGRASEGGPGRRIVYLRPDWVTIVIGSHSDDPHAADAKIMGFLYQPRGVTGAAAEKPTFLLPDEVCHYSPIPDPEAKFRGMSWLTPILREIQSDKSMTLHKSKFMSNAATPNMVIKFDKDTNSDAFEEFIEKFKEHHQGAENAYKTLFLAGGADVTVVGADFKQMDFAAVQGKGENRIAVAAGVPASILGISEGLQGSTLNAGNFGAARRLFIDSTVRDLWVKAAPSLQTLVKRPRETAELAVDDRDIPFLREDKRDAAEIQGIESRSIRTLLDAGYTADSVKAAIMASDWALLQHSGRFSVQLVPPSNESDSLAPEEENPKPEKE